MAAFGLSLAPLLLSLVVSISTASQRVGVVPVPARSPARPDPGENLTRPLATVESPMHPCFLPRMLRRQDDTQANPQNDGPGCEW